MEDRRVVALIIFMGVVILGLGGYIAYLKLFPKESSDNKTTINNVSVDLNNFYQIGETLERLDSAFNDVNSTFYGFIYNQKKVEVSSMDPALTLYITIQKDMIGSGTERFLIGADVKNEFNKIFGKNATYTPSSLSLGNNYNVYYEPTTENFAYVAPITSNIYPPSYVTVNMKTVLDEDKVIVTRKVFFVEYGGNTAGGIDMTKVILYKTPDKSTLLGELNLKNGVINMKEALAKYGSKFSTFDYTFTLEKEDTYSLYSIALSK